MFKISEVAGKLNVETYVIFEKLLTHAELMKDHTQKVHSVSYIDEQGIEIIRALIEGRSPEQVIASENQEVIETQSEDKTVTTIPEIESIPIEVEEDVIDEDWLTEDDFIIIDAEKAKLREEVSQLRQQLIQHDSELKRLDDAIANYQILMREDVDYLIDFLKSVLSSFSSKSIR